LSGTARALTLASLLPREWPGDRFYLSHQVLAAINYTHTGDTVAPVTTGQFHGSVRKLLERLLKSHPAIGFFAWDATEFGTFQPLFARSAILRGIHHLHHYNRALFLVENLPNAIAGEGGYWTRKRQQELAQAHAMLEELIARSAPRHAQWRLIVA